MNPEDILVWSDDEWCFASEYTETLSAQSDDFVVITDGSTEHSTFLKENYS